MRFRGGGVGHKSTRDATKCVYEDRDVMDTNEESGESDITEEAMSVDQSTGDESELNGSNESNSESSEQSNGSGASSDSEADPLEDHELDGFADY